VPANPISRLAILLFIVLALQLAPSAGQSHAPCGVPQAHSDWPVASQAEAGIDSERLCNLVDRLAALDANIHSILVVRRGKLVFEHYRPGADQKWGLSLPGTVQGPDIKHDVRSVSKSVTSLLNGHSSRPQAHSRSRQAGLLLLS
jgi:hypothetical protein